MVRATDLFGSDCADEETGFVLGEIAHFAVHSAWTDDTPPDTPRFGSPDVISSKVFLTL
jgi:hypothetical protein